MLDRATQLLGELAVHHVAQVVHSASRSGRNRRGNDSQLELFIEPSKQVAMEMAGTDIEKLSAEQAVELLRRWKGMFK